VRRTVIAGLFTLPWVVWAVVRTAGVHVGFPFVAVITFTPYAALTSPLPLIAALALRRWLVAGVAALAVAAFVVAMVPRALAGQDAAPQGPRLVVMTSNLYFGQADVRAALQIARERQVDVWAMQESRPAFLAELAAMGGRETFPGEVADPNFGEEGSVILTRLPFESVIEPGQGQPQVRVHPPGAPPVQLMAVHPGSPTGREVTYWWRYLLEHLPAADGQGDARIVMGDFNATLDHPELRDVLDRGYVDAADAVGKGFTWTWPVLGRHRGLPITIDHVLVDRRVRVERLDAVRIPGTDHKALIAVLRLPAAS
jgi:endonuclease/exonuclease/phosphatase family metal-dependent hydrolase